MNKKVLVLICILAFVVIGIKAKSYLSMDKQYTFSTYEGASELIEKGWIPKDLPKDISDIHVSYDLDTNEGNGYFTIKNQEKFIESKQSRDVELFRYIKTKESDKMDDSVRKDVIENPKSYTLCKDDNFIYAQKGEKVYFYIGH